jgi:hypothetical protein
VTAELCHDIINDPSYNVRILSIRNVKNLNHARLRLALQYACRPGRPENTPKLKGLYVFGSRDIPDPALQGFATSVGIEWNQRSRLALSSELQNEGDLWWSRKGRMLSNVPEEWADCLVACQGIIAFDGVLCTGPRHRNSRAYGKLTCQGAHQPTVAGFALPPCDGCGAAPEGIFHADTEPMSSRPLLAPPPILSSSLKAAATPSHSSSTFVPRCADCLHERYCSGCHKWWCESCYVRPGSTSTANQVVVVDEEGDWNLSEGLESELVAAKIKVRKGKCESCSINGRPRASSVPRREGVRRQVMMAFEA